MALKILFGRDGKNRPTWYARYTVKGTGRVVTVNLEIPIEGNVPRDDFGKIALSEKGDADFERSRRRAQKRFEEIREESRQTPEAIQNKAFIVRTGQKLAKLPLEQFGNVWKRKHDGIRTEGWSASVATWFKRFEDFAHEYAHQHGTKCEAVEDITREMAEAWRDELLKSYAWKTVKMQMSILRTTFRQCCRRENPFGEKTENAPSKARKNKSIGRTPLTPDELDRLFACAREDALVYPLIVCAACTGLRIGDVCNLKWNCIDWKRRQIKLETSKTGEFVVLPIFERLAEVLEARNIIEADGGRVEYVFPEAATAYAKNPDGLYRAVKPYFAKAVFDDAEEIEVADEPPKSFVEALQAAGFTDGKRDRIQKAYELRKAGRKPAEIARDMGLARGQVSNYLREAEALTGEELRPKAQIARLSERARLIDKTRKKRGIGKRAASVYGWHSLRGTFVTIAAAAGVPLDDMAKLVGHSTKETTELFYNKPKLTETADKVRKELAGSVFDTPQTATPAEADFDKLKAAFGELAAKLTDKQRMALAAELMK